VNQSNHQATLTPLTTLVTCHRCRGMGGFERGEAFDCCDTCAGDGEVRARLCPVPLLTGDACGERMFITRYRNDEPLHNGWGCINGHHWERTVEADGERWERAADRVSTLDLVAS